MIIFALANGRLGNQIIEYEAIRREFGKNNIIFFIGFCDLLRAVNVPFSRNEIFISRNSKNLRKLLRLAVKFKVFGIIAENYSEDEHLLQKKCGLFNSIYLLDGYFQDRKFLKDYVLTVQIKKHHQELVRNYLCEEVGEKEKNFVFIHVRLGDYLKWPSEETAAALDKSYYNKAIRHISKRVQDPYFLIFSDDIDMAMSYLPDLKKKKIIDSSEASFPLMTYCDHGIMSASSYSWTAAQMSISRFTKKDSIFIAPKYWIGHRSKVWTPPNFKFDWITYI